MSDTLQPTPADLSAELTLRPASLGEYIGQTEAKRSLTTLLQAARQRGEAADHLLFHGPPGLGKTTLASIVARELDVPIRFTSGTAIDHGGDLAAILTNLQPRQVLFIDEIHRLSRAVEEVLYPAMEDGHIDIVYGKGPSATLLRLDVQPFTLIGATTRVGMLSAPLRDRFGAVQRLDYYEDAELAAIVRRSAGILNVPINEEAAALIAARSRGTPRVANRLLRRVRDEVQVAGETTISYESAQTALAGMQIDDAGLDATDRKLLQVMVEKFDGGPVGVAAMAALLGESTDTLEDVFEPYLMRIGFLDRTPQGRVVTERGRAHIGRPNATLWGTR
ncbi:MAG: Holliday junction branch migration DNA helicase RuvB [Chloroflexi bacterium]|jgi:Holliday junction DNA helicase RuvB|nr:MAG: Holliday junction branch migration DNA helicase RuvB [Chloroflexota bacterium]